MQHSDIDLCYKCMQCCVVIVTYATSACNAVQWQWLILQVHAMQHSNIDYVTSACNAVHWQWCVLQVHAMLCNDIDLCYKCMQCCALSYLCYKCLQCSAVTLTYSTSACYAVHWHWLMLQVHAMLCTDIDLCYKCMQCSAVKLTDATSACNAVHWQWLILQLGGGIAQLVSHHPVKLGTQVRIPVGAWLGSPNAWMRGEVITSCKSLDWLVHDDFF